MSLDFNGSTSRRAIILGMTNSDQIGLWQAGPAHAEVLPDAGDVNEAEDAGERNENGLTAAEQAEFDGMRTGPGPTDTPEDDAPAEGDDTGEGDEGDGDDPEAAEAAPAPLGLEKTKEELAAEAATGKKPAPKTVSFGKYQRELKKAREEAAANGQLAQKAREDAIKLAERVAIINEALSQPPAPVVDPNAPPANPFDEEDIDPTVDYAESVKQIQRRQRFQNEHQGRVEQDFTESREDANLRDTFQRDFSVTASREPDLPAAYQFLKDSRLTEICISEFDKDPNDPNEVFTQAEVAKMVQTFNAEEKWVVGNAIKQNKSPAMAIMKLARSRGFKPTPPAARAAPAAPARPAAPQVPAVRNGTGAPPKPAAAAPSAVEMLAQLAANQDAGRSLSDGGGAPPTGLSAEMLMKLSDEEFADLVDQLPKHQLDSLMGRMPG